MLNSSGSSAAKRVLMTADSIGGVWTYAVELAGALSRCNIQISLATMGKPLAHEQREQIKHLPNLEVFESGYNLEWMEDPWEDVRRAGEWPLRLEGALQPDIVHLNGYAHGALPWQSPVLIVGHSCVPSWWNAVRKEAAPSSWNRYREEVARGLQAAQIVIAPSRFMLSALDQYYGPLADGRVVPNGLDQALFAGADESKREFVLTAGRLWD